MGRFLWGQRAVPEPLGQALSFHERHRKVVQPILLADFVNRHDVGMIEPRGGRASA